ncbi:U-box domain-containing protein 21-like [Impatiens glandulifera]|uniref:U-box domain-containing protein 21-like n=1 Tax=Impatiens glandulifera TaxID=253017 RepID=UPI001FB053B3|nr:U-box domain-containing protein 21-like [Impatiens glandulifera]
MISSWRKRREDKRAGKMKQSMKDQIDFTRGLELELTNIPSHFKCPISLDLMKDPVTLSTGITYDRESIETWIETGHSTCPTTNQILTSKLDLVPNHVLRRMIQDWCLDNRSNGVERIPTPRIPLTSGDLSQLLSKLETARRSLDKVLAARVAAKIRDQGRESERNKLFLSRSGAGRILALAFDAFSGEEKMSVLEETLISALAITIPLEDEAKVTLGSTRSLNLILRFLKNGDFSTMMNALMLMKEIVSTDNGKVVEFLMGNELGCLEALVKLIKEPICPITTKASLVTIYHIVSSNDKAKSRLVEMGMVSVILEMLVESDKSICEKALGVLDGICESEEGRKSCVENALTVPVLVKKVLRVSNMATEFAVSILWKLGKKEVVVIIEGLQVGAFQKLLLLLQVGCCEKTKEKVTELLKLLNLHREMLLMECVDSMDFKNIKRTF